LSFARARGESCAELENVETSNTAPASDPPDAIAVGMMIRGVDDENHP
jgi:hypothetical protein